VRPPLLFLLAIVYTMRYPVFMHFEWDEAKNLLNFQKHGIWFEEAQTTWADPAAEEVFDPDHSDDEDRFLRIGYSTKNRLLIVTFCEKRMNKIRIISARKVTPKEREDYEEGI